MAIKQHGVPEHEGPSSLYPYEDPQLDSGAAIGRVDSNLNPIAYGAGTALSPVEAALYLERQRREIEFADLLLGRRTGQQPGTTQVSAQQETLQPNTDAALIQSWLEGANRLGHRVSVTQAGTRRPILPAGPSGSGQPSPAVQNTSKQPSQAKTPESNPTDEDNHNFLRRHKKAIGATALAGLGIAFVTINFVPPAKSFAQETPVIEKLVVFGDNGEISTVETSSPETVTNELVANLPNMTAVASPLLDRPLMITETLPDQPTPELSQQVNLTYTSPEGKQITLDNMLRLTAPNVLLGAFNFKINDENLADNLKYVGDNNFELSLDAINPEAILNSGLKPDGTPITAADLESASPPESVILGINPTDFRWKAVTDTGTLDSNKAVEDYINATFGTDAEAINKSLKDNGLSVASHMSSEAGANIIQDPVFFQDVIGRIESEINAYANSNSPDGKAMNVKIAYTDEQIKAFVDKARSAYSKNDVPLVSGMSYKDELTGLKVPALD